MGFMDSLGNAGRRAQLNGEVTLIDREMVTRKKALGVELYDIIEKQSESSCGLLSTPSVMKNIEREIRGPLDVCSDEVRKLTMEKKELENQLELIEARQEREKYSSNNSWTRRVSDTATETKIWAQVKLLDSQIKAKKEQFGLDCWDTLSQPAWLHDAMKHETQTKQGVGGVVGGVVSGVVKGTKGTVGKMVGKLSNNERAVEKCVQTAKSDIDFMEESKRRKLSELDRIINKK